MLEKQLLHDTEEKENLGEHHYTIIFYVKINQSNFLTPKALSKLFNIRL